MSRSLRVASVLALSVSFLSGCGSAREARETAPASHRPTSGGPAVVAVIDNQPITLAEFEREYAESVGGRENAANDSLTAYKDFLSRYVEFRMKVAEARSAGLADDSSLLAELASYRMRMARPYMAEQEILEPIMRDVFERMQEVVSTSHILIQVAPDASPTDTLAAYNRAVALLDSLKNGADFADLAYRYSEDPSAQRESGPGARGNLGALPTGTLVEEYEAMAYATPVGEVSPVFRTQFGYHILRVNDRAPAVPEIRVAHIMIIPAGRTSQDSTAALDLLRSIKARVEAGEVFADLARQYSEHRATAENGGDLGFYLNYYSDQGAPPSFKDAAFALKKMGEVSDVVQTPFGLHLIQLQDVRDISDYAAMQEQLKQTASRLPRAVQAQKQYLEKIHKQYNLSVDSAYVTDALSSIDNDSLAAALRTKNIPGADLNHTVIQLGDSTYTFADFAAFSAQARVPKLETTRKQVEALLDQYITDVTIGYAGATLEDRNPDFKKIMNDFRDGLLLFRIMEDSVWNAAAQDSVALRAYYATHADEYRFPERTRIITFRSSSKEALSRVAEDLKEGRGVAKIQAAFASDSLAQLRVDTTFVSGASNSMYDRALNLEDGEHTEPVEWFDEYAILLRSGREAPRPKTFEEARAEVISDYQEVLEEELISRLREKYGVEIYPGILGQAFAGDSTAPTISSK